MSYVCANLIKMQIPSAYIWLILACVELVWRLSEFAFFVRLLRWPHFLFFLKKVLNGHESKINKFPKNNIG